MLMEITYLGHSSFKIKFKSATLVTDPFSAVAVGLKYPKVEGELVTISCQKEDHNFSPGVTGEPFVIMNPGEYEIKGVSILGFSSSAGSGVPKEKENTIYVFEAEGIRVCHLGELETPLSAKTLEGINGVDVLLIPIGGVATIGPKEAVEVVGQIEPKVVLPMHFKIAGMNEKNFGRLRNLSDFLEQMAAKEPEKLDKLSISKDKLPEETKVIILERKV